MIACREHEKVIAEEVGPWDCLVKECLRQALNGRLIGSLDVAGETLAHLRHLAHVAGRASL
jgi:hypothetical protein